MIELPCPTGEPGSLRRQRSLALDELDHVVAAVRRSDRIHRAPTKASETTRAATYDGADEPGGR